MLVINSLSFLCLEKSLFHLHIKIKTKLFPQGIEFKLTAFLFLFCALKMLFHSPLACIVSDEKSAVFLVLKPVYFVCLFSPAAFKIFFF